MSSPVYPIFIQKYNSLVADPNADVMTKINSIIDSLNQTGKLTNDIVDQWNKVMAWTMGDGLSTDVNNKLESMLSDGSLTSLFQTNVSSGLTTQRPSNPPLAFQYYDTTLFKPIWCKTIASLDASGNVLIPAVWTDASGNIV